MSVPTTEDRMAFHILCQDDAVYEVEEKMAAVVIGKSDYFRAALCSGFAEAKSRCVKKENWTFETAKLMMELLSTDSLYYVKREHQVNLFDAISELALDVLTRGCGGKDLIDVARKIEKNESSPLMRKDSQVVIVYAYVTCQYMIPFFLDVDEPDIVVDSMEKFSILWQEHDTHMTQEFERWVLKTSPLGCRGDRHLFNVRFALDKFPTVGTALDKLRQLHYGSESSDEEKNKISLNIKAEELAGDKVNKIKKTLKLNTDTGWFDFANDPPTKLKDAMVMCGKAYTKTLKNEKEISEFYSTKTAILSLCNPTIEVLDLFLCLRWSGGTLGSNMNKYPAIFLWPKAIEFLDQLASSTQTCEPLQKVDCFFFFVHKLH